MNVIQVKNLGKKFRLRHAKGQSLKATLIDRILHRETRDDFWALKNISFSIGEGETIGVIGPNGSGKTTLLSILARTMVPTIGSLEVRGQVSCLLELGAGFHPDLTGRENIFLNAAIMGIPRSVIEEKFDRIVEFSGLGQFIETPLRFYSSGMSVRLGFSVAVAADPEILLVDEVLSVGDEAFQKKSGERMREFKSRGKTIVVVSHDMNLIRNFCDQVIYLRAGEVVRQGTTDQVINRYIEDVQAQLIQGGAGLGVTHEWGSREVEIKSVTLTDGRGKPTANLRAGDDLNVTIDFFSKERIEYPVFGFAIHDADRVLCFGSNTQIGDYRIPSIEGWGRLRFRLASLPLLTGDYYLSLSIHSQDHLTNYHRQEYFYPFTVLSSFRGEGVFSIPVTWMMGEQEALNAKSRFDPKTSGED
ncbi:MAG: ABC transporter ATP-binding protein [Candidatus Euphemobacter frigidus]|nr:ABC transporter ATP-binding protein [Candidatus Euphemobacter frigidus]MDP8275392.1 ABC transporter ATP-binding protein [Candidatus Euphemobacter frigidus]